MVLDLGAVLDTCRPGGGLQVGKDGKLFVSTGDLGSSGNAQIDSHTSGKVLRANLDGTVPGDNPSGSLVWSKGYRNSAGLAYNPDTTRAGGTFYVSDVGAASGAIASDEINVVTPSGNYAWDMGSGMYGNGTNDPLVAWGTSALVNPDSMTVLRTPKFGPAHQNALIVAAPTNTTTVRGKVREITLTGLGAGNARPVEVVLRPGARDGRHRGPAVPGAHQHDHDRRRRLALLVEPGSQPRRSGACGTTGRARARCRPADRPSR